MLPVLAEDTLAVNRCGSAWACSLLLFLLGFAKPQEQHAVTGKQKNVATLLDERMLAMLF